MLRQKINQTFSALQYRNYRLWFSGQVVSLVGTWMQSTAQGYLLYELTGSPVMLGVAGFAGGIPVWLFSLYSGAIADRISRRKLVMICQSFMMVLAFILAALTFTKTVQPWHIIVLAFLLGTANAFEAPARQSFVVELVDRADLTNAIALNSSVFNLGTVIGPSVAGLVYAWLGPGWCFTINGISFVAVLIALSMMVLASLPRATQQGSPVRGLTAGIKFAFGHKDIRLLLVNLAAVSIFGFSLLTLMPAWSTHILGGDVKTNGLLLSARGLGSLAGALMIAYVGSRVIRGRIWTAGILTMPVALAIFAIFRVIPVSVAMLVVMGWSLMSAVNVTNALVQTHVPEELRGRVMGLYVLVFQGGMPIGSLLVGWLADTIGEPNTVLVCASMILLTAAICIAIRPSIRYFN